MLKTILSVALVCLSVSIVGTFIQATTLTASRIELKRNGAKPKGQDELHKFQPRMLVNQRAGGQQESWRSSGNLEALADQEQADEMLAMASTPEQAATHQEASLGTQHQLHEPILMRLSSPNRTIQNVAGFRDNNSSFDIPDSTQLQYTQKQMQTAHINDNNEEKKIRDLKVPPIDDYYGSNLNDELEEDMELGAAMFGEPSGGMSSNRTFLREPKVLNNHEAEKFYRGSIANKTTKFLPDNGWLPAASGASGLGQQTVQQQRPAGEKLAELFSSNLGIVSSNTNLASKADMAIEYLRNVLKDKKSSLNGFNSNNSSSAIETDQAGRNSDFRNSTMQRLTTFASRLNQMINSNNSTAKDLALPKSFENKPFDQSEVPNSFLAQQAKIKFSMNDVKQPSSQSIPSSETASTDGAPSSATTTTPTITTTKSPNASQDKFANQVDSGDSMESVEDYSKGQLFGVESQQNPHLAPRPEADNLQQVIRHPFRGSDAQYSRDMTTGSNSFQYGNVNQHYQQARSEPTSTRYFQMHQNIVHQQAPTQIPLANDYLNQYQKPVAHELQYVPSPPALSVQQPVSEIPVPIKIEQVKETNKISTGLNQILKQQVANQEYVHQQPQQQSQQQYMHQTQQQTISKLYKQPIENQHQEEHVDPYLQTQKVQPYTISAPQVMIPDTHVQNQFQEQTHESHHEPYSVQEHMQAMRPMVFGAPKLISYDYMDSGRSRNEASNSSNHYQAGHNLGELFATNYQLGDALYASNGGFEHALTQGELDAIQRQFLTAEHPIVHLNNKTADTRPTKVETILNDYVKTKASDYKDLPTQQHQQITDADALKEMASNQEQDFVGSMISIPSKDITEVKSAESNEDLDKPVQPQSDSLGSDKKKSLIVYLNHPRSDDLSSSSAADKETITAKELPSGTNVSPKDIKFLNEFKLNSSEPTDRENEKDKEKSDGLSVVVINDAYKYKKIVLMISSKTGGLKFIPMVKEDSSLLR